MNVIIGVDPHKATHTAVALDGNELELSEIQVSANASQLKRLLTWAAPFEDRTWAVEGAGGCGYLLSQQLLAVGEAVVDVPATLAARVRVLGSGKSNKNDPIRKSEAWWSLPQDERRANFEERSRHIATGLKYLPAVARRLLHSRDLGEPFDFLT